MRVDSEPEEFTKRRSDEPKLVKTRSLTLSSAPTEEKETKTINVKEVSADILTQTSLHVDAPEFKPRLRSASQPQLSSSLPGNVPNYTKSYKRSREQRGGAKSSRGRGPMPRFFPAIDKENQSEKVFQDVIFCYL